MTKRLLSLVFAVALTLVAVGSASGAPSDSPTDRISIAFTLCGSTHVDMAITRQGGAAPADGEVYIFVRSRTPYLDAFGKQQYLYSSQIFMPLVTWTNAKRTTGVASFSGSAEGTEWAAKAAQTGTGDGYGPTLYTCTKQG